MPPLNPLSRSCLAVAIGQALVVPTQAATITVNSVSDIAEPAGDLSNIDFCTLREAIVSINSATLEIGCADGGVPIGTDDNILFTTPGSTITLTSALPTITNDLSIAGQDLTIDAAGTGNVLRIDGAAVQLNDLNLTGGSALYGGGINARNSASISLSNSFLSGNSAYAGAGIWAANSASVSLSNSTVSGNSTPYMGRGGGIFASSSASISLSNSTVSANSASSSGGGIHTRSSASISLSNSTVSANSADYGGGIYTLSASVSLSNSTVSGNSANNGGGIFATNLSSISVSNGLIGGNRATSNGGEIFNTINIASFSTQGVNLFGDSGYTSAQAFVAFTPGGSDLTATSDGTNPTALADILSPLADNGGATETHLLVNNSPAIGAADASTCPDEDQRGKLRDEGFLVPIVAANRKIAVVDLGGECDIGSVEF